MKMYHNQVLTIICIHRNANNIKKQIYSELGGITLVEIEEDNIKDKKCLSFLKKRAKERNIETDTVLTDKIEKGKVYSIEELNEIFDEWYDKKLKNTIFPQYHEFKEVAKKSLQEKANGDAYDELMSLVGLESTKALINEIIDYFKVQKIYADKGIKKERPALHMCFTGNPGSAKTTCARLLARILKDNNILGSGRFVECGRGDLVGKYVGWTADLVKKRFEQSSGGVLFIDEAYSLVDDRDGSFGDEAINTIVQEMENHRDDVMVIFAGYPDKMEGFLKKNPGLRSRISFHIDFPDYNTDELIKITELFARKDKITFDNDVYERLKSVYDNAVKKAEFGNGRFVRNIMEKAKIKMAGRIAKMDYNVIGTKELTTMIADDIDISSFIERKEIKTIGFAAE